MPNSVRFGRPGSATSLQRSTNLPPNTAFTVMFWFCRRGLGDTGSNNDPGIFCYDAAAANGYSLRFIGTGDGGDGLTLNADNGVSNTNGSATTANRWYHIAITVNGTSGSNFLVYLNGVVDITHSAVTVGGSPTLFFGITTSSEWTDCNVSAIKIYNRVLTADEINAELPYAMPVNTGGLNSAYPMLGDWEDTTPGIVIPRGALTRWADVSGFNSEWTESGTLDLELGPPIQAHPSRFARRSRHHVAAAGAQTLDLGGTVTSAGAATKLASLAKAGTVTSAGAPAKQDAKPAGGVCAPTGAPAKQAQKPLAGAVTSSGVISMIKVVLLALAGAITPAGAIVKLVAKGLAGAVTLAGAIVRLTAKAGAGAVAGVGAVAKACAKPFAGAITSSGAISAIKVVLRALAGTITSSGAITKLAGKALGGSVASAGAIVRACAKGLAGAVGVAGSIAKWIQKFFGGTVHPTGAESHGIAGQFDIGPRPHQLTARSTHVSLAARGTRTGLRLQ